MRLGHPIDESNATEPCRLSQETIQHLPAARDCPTESLSRRASLFELQMDSSIIALLFWWTGFVATGTENEDVDDEGTDVRERDERETPTRPSACGPGEGCG